MNWANGGARGGVLGTVCDGPQVGAELLAPDTPPSILLSHFDAFITCHNYIIFVYFWLPCQNERFVKARILSVLCTDVVSGLIAGPQ